MPRTTAFSFVNQAKGQIWNAESAWVPLGYVHARKTPYSVQYNYEKDIKTAELALTVTVTIPSDTVNVSVSSLTPVTSVPVLS